MHQVYGCKLFTRYFICLKQGEVIWSLVNNGDKFFQTHRLFISIRNLFTTIFESFFSSVNPDQMANRPISDVREEKQGKGQFFDYEDDGQSEDEVNKGAEACACLPVNVFETRVGNVAYHEARDGEHQWRQEDCEDSQIETVEHQHKRSGHSGGGWDGQTEVVFCPF